MGLKHTSDEVEQEICNLKAKIIELKATIERVRNLRRYKPTVTMSGNVYLDGVDNDGYLVRLDDLRQALKQNE